VERLIAESINEGEDNHCDKRKSEMHQRHAGNKQHTVITQIAVRAQGLFGRVRILPPICDQEWRRKGGSRSQDGESCEEAQRSKHVMMMMMMMMSQLVVDSEEQCNTVW
jgi:hypothetical protein